MTNGGMSYGNRKKNVGRYEIITSFKISAFQEMFTWLTIYTFYTKEAFQGRKMKLEKRREALIKNDWEKRERRGLGKDMGFTINDRRNDAED